MSGAQYWQTLGPCTPSQATPESSSSGSPPCCPPGTSQLLGEDTGQVLSDEMALGPNCFHTLQGYHCQFPLPVPGQGTPAWISTLGGLQPKLWAWSPGPKACPSLGFYPWLLGPWQGRAHPYLLSKAHHLQAGNQEKRCGGAGCGRGVAEEGWQEIRLGAQRVGKWCRGTEGKELDKEQREEGDRKGEERRA